MKTKLPILRQGIIRLLLTILMAYAPSILVAQTYSGYKVVNASNSMTISIVSDPSADSIQLTLTGPTSVWFGFGFGTSSMTDTYAIITTGDGTISERKLGNHNQGNALTSSFSYSDYSIENNTSVTVVTRSLSGLNSDYFTFSEGAVTISLLWAFGNTSDLAYHANRGATTISLTEDCDATSSEINPVVCESYTSPSGNHTYYASGQYFDTIPNTSGCDSIITINLLVNNTSSVSNVSACASYTSPSGNQVWTSTGIYIDTIPNAAGCDSIMTIYLTINNTFADITANACDEYISPSGNYTWNTSGMYIDTILNSLGCDSIISVDLTMGSADVSIVQEDATLTANAEEAIYQWLDCDNDYAPISGETNKVFTASESGNYAVVVSQNNCTDTSMCYSVTLIDIAENNFENSIQVYPNPTNGKVFLKLSNEYAHVNVSITDISGKLISSNVFNKTQTIELSIDGELGFYIIHIESQNGHTAKYKILRTN